LERLFTIRSSCRKWATESVFIGVGAGYPKLMGIPGEGLNGIFSATNT